MTRPTPAQRRAERARTERRTWADAAWKPGLHPDTRTRTAMEIAAFLLDEAGEAELADWLLCARPEHAREVATGVAVHALLRCVPHAWDALMQGDAADLDQASLWLGAAEEDFVWGPEPAWLLGKE